MNANNGTAQLSLLDIGPARVKAADFWTREDEDREDYAAIAHDDHDNEEI